MADDLGAGEIVHAGPAQALVVPEEAAGLDDIHRHAEAGGEAQNRAAVLRNIGLEQGKAHGDCRMLGKGAELHYTRPGPGNCSAAPGPSPGVIAPASVCRRTGGISL